MSPSKSSNQPPSTPGDAKTGDDAANSSQIRKAAKKPSGAGQGKPSADEVVNRGPRGKSTFGGGLRGDEPGDSQMGNRTDASR